MLQITQKDQDIKELREELEKIKEASRTPTTNFIMKDMQFEDEEEVKVSEEPAQEGPSIESSEL